MIDFVDGVKSHVEHDKSRGSLHSSSDELASIVNIFDSPTHPVTKFCD